MRRGYTLLELLLGIGILAITITIVVQRYRADSGFDLRSHCAPLVQALSQASENSVRLGVAQRFCFEVGTQKYWVEAQESDSERFTPTGVSGQVERLVSVTLDDGVPVDESAARLSLGGGTRNAVVRTIHFRPDGRADSATLQLSRELRRPDGTHRDRMEIRIDPDTGRVRVVEM